MELRSLIWKLLKEQLDQNTVNLKNKYVGEDKPVSEDDFNKIVEVTGNKFYLLSWLTKKVGTGMIKPEDIYKYKEYFELFEKNKNKFQHKDIHLYKTSEDVKNFLKDAISVRESDIVYDEIQGLDNYVTQNEIEKLESTGGMKYLGMYQDKKYKYQVFQVFGYDQDTWKIYRDILGRCKGRNRGAKIDICTIGNYKYFKSYLTDPKGSNYFLLFNLDDPKSPYQLHFESDQFMDKNDNEASLDQYKFYEFVGERVPQYSMTQDPFPGNMEIPVKDKGYLDSRRKKNGLWKQYDQGKLIGVSTYEKGKLKGPFVVYDSKGGISVKGNHSLVGLETLEGPFERYHDGKLEIKGIYGPDGYKDGVWFEKSYYSRGHRLVDYSEKNLKISGFTEQGKLRFISSGSRGSRYQNATVNGKITIFYPSGKVFAVGRYGKNDNRLGDWVYYYPDGSLRAKGKFNRYGTRDGEWIDVVKTKDNTKLILQGSFPDVARNKIKVSDSSGKFIKNAKIEDFEPEEYWHHVAFNLYSFR